MKFSIIVPVYNVEKYLEECVDSLLKQNYIDFEIILIDDGSTDNSAKICDNYVRKNTNISVIHKENGGLSDARNIGIKKSNGEYLIFIDSDDYIEDENFLADISQIIDKENSDLIIFGNKKLFEDNTIVEKKYYIKDNKENVITSLISQNYLKACAWDKVVKRELIFENSLYFPVGRFSEDIEWCAKLLKSIDFSKINVLNKNVYVYRQRKNSITRSVKPKNITDMMEMIKNEFLEEDDEKSKIINSFLAYEYAVVLGLINISRMIKLDKEIKSEVLNYKKILKYDMSKKVKKVNMLVNFFRNRNCRKNFRIIYRYEIRQKGIKYGNLSNKLVFCICFFVFINAKMP